jgi:hypothetical protein
MPIPSIRPRRAPEPEAVHHPSGEHPAVKAFRAKLDSVADHEVEDLKAIDRDLAAYLADVKTPIPPKPGE